MGNVYAGYRGLANIGGVGQVRFASASITAKQTVNAPDLIMGDWDHDAYNFGPIEIGGSIAGPVTETFMSGSGGGSGLWDWGVKRTAPCGSLSEADTTLWYYCGGAEQTSGRLFPNMLVNTLGFSCAAGDVAQFTMDLLGYGEPQWVGNGGLPHFLTAEKLLTWDKVTVTVAGGSEFTVPANIAYSNFNFSIGNNLQTVYSLGQPNLLPFEIVPGLRTITGSISVYNVPDSHGALSWDDYTANTPSTITFNIGTIALDMKVRFHRVEPASSVTPIISTIGFTGVTHQTGAAWE